MKNLKYLFSLAAIFLMSFAVQAQNKAEFKVLGNCGMCKTKIEKAAKSVKGVKMATWDSKAEKITVYYSEKKTELTTIKQAIADVGYDTDTIKAKDEVYDNLHFCCKYERDL